MRVYLLNPASRGVLRSPVYRQLFPSSLPASLATLGAVLRDAGHVVQLRDQEALAWPNDQVAEEIAHFEPDLIGVSTLTVAWPNTATLVRQVQQRCPRARLVLGNIHATVFAESLLRKGYADYVVRGEGEQTLVELAAACECGGDLVDVSGLSWRDGTTVRHNPDRSPIADLDELPYPAWDLLDLSAYRAMAIAGLRSQPVFVQGSRGCAHRCVFCAQDKIVRRFRARQVECIVDEIDTMVRRYDFRSVLFSDAYFPWSREVGLEFAARLETMPWRGEVGWVAETRVDAVDDELVAALARSGLRTLLFGFESGNSAVLRATGKGTTVDQGREAVRIARRHGVRVLGFFLIGLPGDTEETVHDTVRFAIDSGVDIAKFGIVVPAPGSALFEELGRVELSFDECERMNPFFDWAEVPGVPLWAPEGLTRADLLRLQRGAMTSFYARPSYVLRALIAGLFSPREIVAGAWMIADRKARSLFAAGP